MVLLGLNPEELRSEAKRAIASSLLWGLGLGGGLHTCPWGNGTCQREGALPVLHSRGAFLGAAEEGGLGLPRPSLPPWDPGGRVGQAGKKEGTWGTGHREKVLKRQWKGQKTSPHPA